MRTNHITSHMYKSHSCSSYNMYSLHNMHTSCESCYHLSPSLPSPISPSDFQLRVQDRDEGRQQDRRAGHVQDQLHGPPHHRRVVQGDGRPRGEDIQQEPALKVPLGHGGLQGLEVLSDTHASDTHASGTHAAHADDTRTRHAHMRDSLCMSSRGGALLQVWHASCSSCSSSCSLASSLLRSVIQSRAIVASPRVRSSVPLLLAMTRCHSLTLGSQRGRHVASQ